MAKRTVFHFLYRQSSQCPRVYATYRSPKRITKQPPAYNRYAICSLVIFIGILVVGELSVILSRFEVVIDLISVGEAFWLPGSAHREYECIESQVIKTVNFFLYLNDARE